MIFSDRCELSDRESVMALQEKLVTCLEALIAVRAGSSHNGTGSSGTALGNIISVMIQARSLDEIESKNARDLLCNSGFIDGDAFPLFREMFI